jgi:hypothetical protein
LLIQESLTGDLCDKCVALENRVTIGAGVILDFETDQNGNPSGALHRLSAICDDSYNFAGLVGRQVDALRHFFVVLDQLLPDDGFLLVFRLAWLEQA